MKIRVTLMCLVVAIIAASCMFMVCKRAIETNPSVDPKHPVNVIETPTNTFGYVKGKLAIVSFVNGQGSGFVLQQAGKKYLITNEHVVRVGNGELPNVMLLDGKRLGLGACEVSRDRDLMRFEISSDVPALSLGDIIPEIDDDVSVYGNSDGGGVSTEIKGKVLGVGGDRIEVSAPFVTGNSGSPVVDKNGRVVGVATYLTNYTNEFDWAKKGTRFNGVRRFATRLAEIPWLAIEWNEYARQIKAFNDIQVFMEHLSPYVLYCFDEVGGNNLSYSERNRLKYSSTTNGLHAAMIAVHKAYTAMERSYLNWRHVAKGKDDLMNLPKKDAKEKELLLRGFDALALDKLATAIECGFEFNKSIQGALTIAQGVIEDSAITLPVLKIGIKGMGSIDDYNKLIDIALMELDERRMSCSNIVGFASSLLSEDSLYDKELGLVLLMHTARLGNKEAIQKIVSLYEDYRQNELLLQDKALDKDAQRWLKEAFKNGTKKVGLILGELAYQRMQYNDAQMYWESAAEAGVVDAMVRMGKFYLLPQESGGGPENMRNIEKARKAFKMAYESDSDSDARRKGAQYYGAICVKHPVKKEDLQKAMDIFSALINEAPEVAVNYWMRGVATYVLEHGRYNGTWRYYINKAAELGHALAKRSLSDLSALEKSYKDAMRSMRLPIGGVGVTLGKMVDEEYVGEEYYAPYVYIDKLCIGNAFGEKYSVYDDGYYKQQSRIFSVFQGEEKIPIRGLSSFDVGTLLRGDVGSELVVEAGLCKENGRWTEKRLFRVKRIRVKAEGPLDF